MDTNSVTTLSRSLSRQFSRNSPTILTALGVAGLLGTVILAVKATPKALAILESEEKFRITEYQDPDYNLPISPKDVIRLTWQEYIPSAIMGVVTIGCMIGANSIHLRRNAALASLYSLAETTLREYQEKVVEKIGDKKEEKIRGEIAQDKINSNPVDKNTVIMTNRGSMLCYDSLSGRYFYSDIETIRKAENDFNKRLMNEMVIPLNEFYDDLGLEPIDIGGQTGWKIEKGMVVLHFAAKLTADGQPCIVLEHRNLPTNIWG